MNFNILKINVVVLVLAVQSEAGVYERVKDTASGLTQDVKNVWSYSKSLVGLGKPDEATERGLVGGMLHSAHEKIHYLYEELWAVDEIPNDSGMLWNMYCRLKQRLAKAKHFIIGDKNERIEDTKLPPNPEAIIIKEAMEKIFNPDGTRKITGEAFNEAVENLKNQINKLRKDSEDLVNNGEGIINVRMGNIEDDLKETIAETNSVASENYDKVNDGLNTANINIRNQANVGKESITNNVNKLQDAASDAAAKGRDVLDATNNKLST